MTALGPNRPALALRKPQWLSRVSAYDAAALTTLAALAVIALATYGSYAISNDEPVQQHYGELIVAYYRSGFADQSLFHYQNLYLYGGLFDVVADLLQELLPSALLTTCGTSCVP